MQLSQILEGVLLPGVETPCPCYKIMSLREAFAFSQLFPNLDSGKQCIQGTTIYELDQRQKG